MATAPRGRPVRPARRVTTSASRDRRTGPSGRRSAGSPRCGVGPGRDESGDAGHVVRRVERVVPDHHVEAGHGAAVRVVDGEPGRVADDVEARVRGLPLLGQSAAQQPVHLDAPVEFLAEVLAPGVGDAQPQRELQHRGGARAVDGAYGGGGVPGGAVGAEVAEQTGLEQGRDLRAVAGLADLPGVQREGRVAVGQRQCGADELRGELLGADGAAALGPGGVRGEYGGGHRQPVQREGAAQLR